MLRRFATAAVAALALAACSDDSTAPVIDTRTVFGLTDANRLVRFSSATPGTIDRDVAITGLASGDRLVGIDFRTGPSVGGLFGVGANSNLYVIDTVSGAATLVGALANPLNAGAIGQDFNPTVDRIRVHSSTRQNLRLNQTTVPVGATIDAQLAYQAGDPGASLTPRIVGTAYTNATPNVTPTSTVLYVIDAANDVLAVSNVPNSGTLLLVGRLGVDASDNVGFDIGAGSNVGLAAVQPSGASASTLYTVNLTNGALSAVGPISAPSPLVGIAVRP